MLSDNVNQKHIGFHFYSAVEKVIEGGNFHSLHRPVAFTKVTFIILEYLKYLVLANKYEIVLAINLPIMGKVRKSFKYYFRPLDFLWNHHLQPVTI